MSRSVPCGACGAATEPSPDVWAMKERLDALRVLRGDQPLREDELVRCPKCLPRWRAERERAAREEWQAEQLKPTNWDGSERRAGDRRKGGV